MELGITVVGTIIGGVIGALSKKKGKALTYALLGGGTGLAATLLRDKLGYGSSHRVGQLAQSLPTPGLPGQFTYATDPRRDPLLDPISREQQYPAWLLAHWQKRDRNIVAQVQQMLGTPADGNVGDATVTALRTYQAHAGLSPSGVMDYDTMRALVSG